MNKKTLVTCCAASLMLCGSVLAADKQTMIVFDASGSMWGQIEGKAKITLAREAMAGISDQFQADDAIGLMAYGHRRKGDCSDIELMVPVAKNTAQSLVDTVNNIKPKGKTPIAQALKMATDELKIAENAAEVVLISDGLETCDLDPCKMAEEAESLGIDFTAHVIGFGLSAEEGKQLSCVADITGGQYLQAQDADSLKSALNQVLTEETPEPEPVTLPEATITAPAEMPAIGSTFSVQWTGPAGKDDYIDVVKVDYDKTYGELSYAWAKKGSPAEIKAPGKVGLYQLRYVMQHERKRYVLASADFEVVDSEVSLIAPSAVAAGETFTVSWTGPNEKNDYVDLVKRDDTRTYGEISHFYTQSGETGQLLAPAEPGSYDIRYILQAPDGRKILHRIPIDVTVAEVTLSAPPEVNIGQTFEVFWTGPQNDKGYIDLVKRDETRTYGELSYFYMTENPESGELMAHVVAGEYDIRFIMVGSDGRKIMAVTPIEIKPVLTTLSAPEKGPVGETINVTWQGPDTKGDYVDLVTHNRQKTYGELSYFYTESNPESGTLTLPDTPGTYTIRYIVQGKSRVVGATKDIVVE